MKRLDAHQRRRSWFYTGLALVSGLPMALLACSGDDDSSSDGPVTTGGSGGSAGDGGADDGTNSGGSSSGGTSAGSGGTDNQAGGGGDSNTGGGGSGGTGGSSNTGTTSGTGGGGTPASVDDVVAAVCEWEFRCCDEGEIDYRLSPFATDAETCTERLVFEVNESNSTDNPYLSGPAAPGGLLGTLGYVVDLERATPNPEGILDCVANWDALDCNEAVEADARCAGPGEADPCALTNLLTPALALGEECTIGLAETTVANDVECAVGSTCLAVGAGNPNDVPTCVKRGLADDPCSFDPDCDFNHYCDAGKCTEKAGIGDPCSYAEPDAPVPGEYDVECAAGLFCHPVELECMAACDIGSSCTSDNACPSGSGCVPLEVNDSSDAFMVCTDLGDSAEAVCNTDADCEADFYCDNTNCQADKQANAACIDHKECAAGLHCDLATTSTCVTNLAAAAACTAAYQCGPNSAGCLSDGAAGTFCRNSLLALEATCGSNADCASGRCEVADGTAVEATCVRGAGEGDPCDMLPTDGTAQSCARGLLCFGPSGTAGGGTCATQAAPGTECDNPDGDPDAAMCANASYCTDPWGEGETCSDAPVSEQNGGSGITCDGD